MRILIARLIVGGLLAVFAAPLQAQRLMVWGDDASRQLSDAPTEDVRAVKGGSINGLALLWDRTPFLWGTGSIGPTHIPVELQDEEFYDLEIARDDAVLMRKDGTLVGFGKHPLIVDVPPGVYRNVAVASVFAVAIAEDGTLTAWGSDSAILPSGGTVTGLLNAPEGGPFQEVAASLLYSLALAKDGTLYGWGGPGFGGVNILAGWTPTPEDPQNFYRPGERYTAIAAGIVHALALLPDGTVTGWGNESGGVLNAPSHVRFKAIAAGWGFSIGLSVNGTLWGWGSPTPSPFAAEGWTFADQGWTRFGDTGHYYVPDVHFKSIAAAAFHIMAITTGRDLLKD